jgi:TM2 domain-containing membrane protein YozV
MEDATTAQIIFSQLKDPTIALVLSIVVGAYGVDRFYIGDIGLGVGKVLTCGGALIWYLIDIFMIQDATRRKNFETVMMQLH